MVEGHKIQKRVNINEFLDRLKECEIKTTDHTFFRLNKRQRKIFKEKIIKEIILSEDPFLIGIQKNKNYAVFYNYKKDVLKIILDMQFNKINIVTFYIIDKKQVPKI